MRIETERLILRKFKVSDYREVLAFDSNPEVNKYTGDDVIDTTSKAKSVIKNVMIKDYNNYGYGRLATVYKPDMKIIGFAGLKYLKHLNETDLGFRFLPQYWNKGIATEAGKALIDYGFKELNLNKIIAIAMPVNIGSCRALEKIGFTFYKTDDYDGDNKSYNWYQIFNPQEV